MRYGDLVVTTGRQARAAHMVTDAINGGARTSCGLFLPSGKHRPAPENSAPCAKCASHLADAPDRKRFVRDAYARSG